MEEWVKKAKAGDREAWTPLVRQYEGMAFAVAYERLRDVQLAEDAVQEAFVEAYAGLHRLEQEAAFAGWLKTIVRRRAGRRWRRASSSELPVADHSPFPQEAEEPTDAASAAERRELKKQIHASIDALPEKLRLPVRLFYFEGYSVRESAEFLGVSESALKKRLFDARSRLRPALHVSDFYAAFRDLYEGGRHMLHIVNGDHTAKLMQEAGIEGEILVWRELYPFGPVFPDMEEASARFARAEYLERELGIPRAFYLEGCAEQERKLRELEQYEEVVLWFEHDLFDQTMLAVLLGRIERMRRGRTRLSLLSIGEFPGIELFRGFGQLRPEQLKTLSGTWQPVGEEQFAAASRFWSAYSSPDLEEHVRFLEADSSALPFARAAFEAHLSRLPSAEDGLGSIQRAALEAAASGAAGPAELFRLATDELVALGLGDLEFFRHLEWMAESPSPLLTVSGEGAFPKFGKSEPNFGNRRFAPSELGRRILAGEAAAPADAGAAPERVGGLRLEAGRPLRP
ncbi:RNA polymerase subunit sigma [Saccharibacillus sp. O23]|uniref:sigma-70 family RNA polymerase sigma factor n=1 Tax=Saccharibacillus sp. O23 TaxID=2009338 RepID=UPI000B4DFF53|nr:sigma-70 family RNA polymerase sigma factor [Saccharibacillus sp. O23]OWR31868.1 RNA polymerase subunit sigma [Saccharibacillus sp. O23]